MIRSFSNSHWALTICQALFQVWGWWENRRQKKKSLHCKSQHLGEGEKSKQTKEITHILEDGRLYGEKWNREKEQGSLGMVADSSFDWMVMLWEDLAESDSWKELEEGKEMSCQHGDIWRKNIRNRGHTGVKDLGWEHDSVFKERWKGQGSQSAGERPES